MSVNNKTVNRNEQGINQERAGLAVETAMPPLAAASAGQPFVVLDDLAPPALPSGSLASNDLKVLRAMQSILEKRQNDAWIDEMRAQITSELEWDEA
jgi:hypothetical protein